MKMMHNTLTRSIIFLGVCLLFLSIWVCSEKAETVIETETQSSKIKRVKVSMAEALPPSGSIEYVGVLSAFRKVNVASETGGTIERLYFEKGDRVRKGQLLAEISTSSIRLAVQQAKAALQAAKSNLEKMEKGSRPEEILIAEAALREAEAALLEAEKNFNRIKGLFASRSVSDSEYDSTKRMVDMARAKMESAKQQLALAREGPRIEDRKAARANVAQAKAALALANDRLRKSKLHAPCDGIIAFRDVEEGEVIVVPPVTIITQVVDLERLKIKVSLGEKDIHILDKHEDFTFTMDAFPQENFSCRLLFRSPTADPATKSFPLELMVNNPDARMADGMTVRVKFPILNEQRTLKVPSTWLSEENGKIGLFVVKDDRAVFREVTLGAYYDQRIEILSGLNENEKELIITRPSGVKSGDAVAYESD
jgi:multidrug efflux pump subunit AcrA (membrane-fusion protein)